MADIDQAELTTPSNGSAYHPYMGATASPEERHEAPTTPDAGNTEQPNQRPDSEHESDCGDQADDQSNEASVASQQQKPGRFLGRLRKRRITDSAAQAGASTEQAAKKSKIGMIGILITALVGFFFGIGSNQVTDYVKRADDCSGALSEYYIGVLNFPTLSGTVHDQSLTDDQRDAAGGEYNTLIISPHNKITIKCPIDGSLEYLNSDERDRFKASFKKLSEGCFKASECSQDNAYSYTVATTKSAFTLASEATKVSQWGLFRRAKYELTHLY